MNVSGRPSWPSRTTMTVEAGRGITGFAWGAPCSAEVDKDLSILDLERVARRSGVPLWEARATRASVELPQVPRAPDHAVFEFTACQRSALVRATVGERGDLSIEIHHHQL